jgi:proline dehydrogenase
MNPIRSMLLAAAQNAWLRNHAASHKFAHRAVSRFMPGEHLNDALAAAEKLQSQNLGSIFTRLGENIGDAAEARSVAVHYLEVLQAIRDQQLPTEISIKPTQLGLDLSADLCWENLQTILAAESSQRVVWIDMEASHYVNPTLALYRRALAEFPNTGLCLQAYLRRTANDLAELLPLNASIRLVKGAYSEPPAIAFPDKSDVDKNYFALAQSMLAAKKSQPRIRSAFGTHDLAMIRKLIADAASQGLAKKDLEVQMLFGIQSAEQLRLVSEGLDTKVLVSYGSNWYAWFMRRLAERPANLWFVAKNLFLAESFY